MTIHIKVSTFLLLLSSVSHASQVGGKGILGPDEGERCVGSDSSAGVCLGRLQCSRQGGKAVGHCGLFSSCCSLSACDYVTNAKDAVFSNPPFGAKFTGLECSYNVEIYSSAVCQIRVDLEIFSLSLPTDPSGSSDTTATAAGGTAKNRARPWEHDRSRRAATPQAYACRDDVFQVTNLQAYSESIPSLCGENSGQHVYLRVNASVNSRAARFTFKIADRTNRGDLAQPTWRVRITQLECYNTLGIQNKPSSLDVLTANYAVYQPFFAGRSDSSSAHVIQKRNVGGTAAEDAFFIAPPGCLQYYPERAGNFESFNYNRGKGPYLGNLRYSTCFGKGNDICGLKLTSSSFKLSFATATSDQVDKDCETPVVAGQGRDPQDYLLIPDGEVVGGVAGSKWCGESADDKIITSYPFGQLAVLFNSDDRIDHTRPEVGYRFHYNFLNNCK